MKKSIVPPTSSAASVSSSPEKLTKLIAFNIGKLNLALPIESVVQVTACPTIHGSGLASLGITQVGDRQVTVIDLYRHLFKASSPQEQANTCLLVGQTQTGELFGIPLQAPPSLLEIPVSSIRYLPETYRRADTLGIADRIAMVTHTEKPFTLFCLDVEIVLSATHGGNYAIA